LIGSLNWVESYIMFMFVACLSHAVTVLRFFWIFVLFNFRCWGENLCALDWVSKLPMKPGAPKLVFKVDTRHQPCFLQIWSLRINFGNLQSYNGIFIVGAIFHFP